MDCMKLLSELRNHKLELNTSCIDGEVWIPESPDRLGYIYLRLELALVLDNSVTTSVLTKKVKYNYKDQRTSIPDIELVNGPVSQLIKKHNIGVATDVEIVGWTLFSTPGPNSIETLHPFSKFTSEICEDAIGNLAFTALEDHAIRDHMITVIHRMLLNKANSGRTFDRDVLQIQISYGEIKDYMILRREW